MNIHGTAESARKIYSRISPWNVAMVGAYLVEKEGMNHRTVAKMGEEYKRFLALSLASDETRNVPISIQVDPFWHTHIIFSQDYTKMCHYVADGHYIHHVPAVTDEERGRLCDVYTNGTIPLYREVFGEPDPEFWPPEAQICIACCDRPGPMRVTQKLQLMV